MSNILKFEPRPSPKPPANPTTARWRALVTHRTHTLNGDVQHETATYYFEEMDDLSDIIEDGPHWGTIAAIQIYLNRVVPGQSGPTFTQEQAECL